MKTLFGLLERVVRFILLKPVYGEDYDKQNWNTKNGPMV